MPDGLAFDPVEHTISGAPQTAFATATPANLVYTVTDANGASTIANFTLQVANAPSFGAGASIDDQFYTVGIAIPALTLPAVSGGVNAPLTPMLTPALPAGLNFDAATRVLSGTPSAHTGTAENPGIAVGHTYSAGDSNGVSANLFFDITVSPAPAFDTGTIAAPEESYDFVLNRAITPLILPPASGIAPFTYSLMPVPDGLAFDATSRTLSGAPGTVAAAAMLTYTATDSNPQAAQSVALTFSVEVFRAGIIWTGGDFVETAANDGSVSGSLVATLFGDTFAARAGDPTKLPMGSGVFITATGVDADGNALFSSGVVTRNSPSMVTMTLSGNAAKHSDADDFVSTESNSIGITFKAGAFTTLTAAEVDNNQFAEGTIDFNDPDPLVFTAAIADQTYPPNVAITPLTLPTASGGLAPRNYTLLPAPLPPGLTFAPATRTLSGMPSEQATTTLIYTVTDADTPAATAVLPFSVTVGTSGGVATGAITLTPTSVTVAEGATTTYTAVLSLQPGAEVLVAISDDNPDVTALPAILTFTTTDWDTPQTVTVSARDDVDVANDTATLTHSASDSNYAAATLAVTVTDDDGGIVLTPVSLSLAEGTTASYSVALQGQPSGTVTVGIVSDNTDVTTNPVSLSFTTANWNITRTVQVTAAADADAADDTDTLTHTASGGGYALSDTLTVSVTDPDTPSLVLTLPLQTGPTAVTLDEGTATYTYTVALATQPTDTVTVNINWSATTPEIRFTPRPLTFTTNNWNIPQTVTVTAGEDADTQPESGIVMHDPSGGDYDNAPTVPVDYTVIDNDKLAFDAPLADQTYAIGQMVNSVLPAASGGIGTLAYTLTGNLPGGLSFDSGAHAIIGIPNAASAATSLTYTVTDGFPDSLALTFTVTVVDRPVVTISDTIEIGTPATRLTDSANSADGALTFTFTWSEAVTGFEKNDIGVTGGGSLGDFETVTDNLIYTLVVTPTAATNDGELTITVADGVAHSMGENIPSLQVIETQAYDTQVPLTPTIDTISGDNILNQVERTESVTFTGGVEDGAGVELCLTEAATVDVCIAGTTVMTTNTSTTTWSVEMDSAVISALPRNFNRQIEDFEYTARALATDTAGNPSPAGSEPFRIDALAPGTSFDFVGIETIAEDDIINAAERARPEGVILTGEATEMGVSIRLCFNDHTTSVCGNGTLQSGTVTVTGIRWSYRLTDADFDILIPVKDFATVQVSATDASGNIGGFSNFKIFTVDVATPEFTSATSAAIAVNTPIAVVAYDANATDNLGDGSADDGLTYSLSGEHSSLFNIAPESGLVTYKTVQMSAANHNITITATDTAGNTAAQIVAIEVQAAPVVTITDDVVGDYAAGVINFNLTFSESVSGLTPSDITVTGDGMRGDLSITTNNRHYVLSVIPDPDVNDGVLTFTLAANAVTNAGGVGNLKATATRKVDTVAPVLTDSGDSDGDGDHATAAAMFVIGDSGELYDATATDGSGAVDAGITYSLSGTNAGLYAIDSAGGSITYRTDSPNTGASHTLVITATDKGGGTDTQTLTVTLVTRSTVVSVRGTDGSFYRYDAVLPSTVPMIITFSEAVSVTGIPQLTLDTGNSAGNGIADYDSGTNTTELTFHYTVRAGDDTRKLAYISIDALTLGVGVTIQNAAAAGVDAVLTLPAPGDATSLSGSSTVVLDNEAPVFSEIETGTGTSASPIAIMLSSGTLDTSMVYDANATDNGRATDLGIAYSLSGDHAATFVIKAESGILTPAATLSGEGTYSVTITAMDEALNADTLNLEITAVDLPTVTISDSITGIANIDSGEITFTFVFDEEVTGFDTDDISVKSDTGTKGDFETVTAMLTYTLKVTPKTGINNGTLVITVRDDAATAVAGSDRRTLETSHSQMYDTRGPDEPTFDDFTADNIINADERNEILAGDAESGSSVILCFNDGSGTIADCTGGLRANSSTTGTAWSFVLSTARLSTIGQGNKTARAIATDTNGNPGAVGSKPFSVDTMAPAAPSFAANIAGDNRINAAERVNLVIISGTNTDDTVAVTLCLGAASLTDADCSGGTTLRAADGIMVTGMDWSYTLSSADVDAIGQGDGFLTATAIDMAGNISVAGGTTISVDTILPVVPSIGSNLAGDNFINAAERTNGVDLSGSRGDDADITLCFNATDAADATCTGGTLYPDPADTSGNSWSYSLNIAEIDALNQGMVTLTVIATDAYDNTRVSAGRIITVDTVVPVFANATDTATLAANTAAGVPVYDAAATDGTDNADTGISYTLGGTDAEQFSIFGSTGVVIYRAVQPAAVTHSITITATDMAGNAAKQTVTVRVLDSSMGPTLIITNNIDDGTIANSADGALIFTFAWIEAVTGFEKIDISVTGGGSLGDFETVTANLTYTLVVTPTTNTDDGVLTITVAEGVATSMANGSDSRAAVKTQAYDTQAPAAPTFEDFTADDIINLAESTETLAGNAESGSSVTLCFNDGSGAVDLCPNGLLVADLSTPGTAWSVALTTARLSQIGEGEKTARAIATDANGNPGAVGSKPFSVDTEAPAAPSFAATIAVDNIINIAERDIGVEVSGTNEAEAGITLCAGATPATDPTCSGGTTFPVTVAMVGSATTTWSYTLTADDISTIGNRKVTLTAIAADAAGNTAVSAEDISITVDTVAPPTPTIDSPVAGDSINAAAPLTVSGTKDTAARVTLCIGATDATDADCGDGTTYDTTDDDAAWSYELTIVELTALPEGSVTLTAIAVDAAGNKAVSPGHDITVDTIAPVFTPGGSGSVGVNAAIAVIAYDAEATDNGLGSEIADTGISYTLGGADALTFMIDEDSGEVTYKVVQTSATIAPHHVITITATDAAGNTATQPVTISVLNAPTVTIADNFAGDYADGLTAITFTYTFSEPVTGFTEADIVVEPAADSVGAIIQASNFTEVTAGRVYTQDLLFHGGASPNDGTVTVRVPADAVIGTLTKAGNLEATATQRYDSVSPASNALSEVSIAFDVAGGGTEVYNAEFTDGADADVGITYSLTDAVTGSDHAALFTLNPDSGSVTFNASPTPPATYNIVITGKDKAGRSANTRLNISVVTRPMVVSVAATDGFHTGGGSVPITVTFSEAVTVAGTPRLALTTGNIAGPGTANYFSGSGSDTLTFTYSVLDGDNSRGLAYAGTTALSLNGGTIQSVATTAAANLTLPMPGTANSLSVTSTVVLDNAAPIFLDLGDSFDPRLVTVTVGTLDTSTTVYDANAMDNGRMADFGITYELGGVDALTFELDVDSGVLTPAVTVIGAGTYNVTITATDELTHVATQYLRIVVTDLPVLTITDSITGIANSADGVLTFSFAFSEEVMGFADDDIRVDGGDIGMLTEITVISTNRFYTLLATPLDNTNGGVLTITVRADAVMAAPGDRSNVETTHEQPYDTLAPDAPGIDDPVAIDNTISLTERDNDVIVRGTNAADVNAVTLCAGATDATDVTCTGGRMYTAAVDTTTWSYTLTTDNITALGNGDVTLTAIATDAVGNPAVSAGLKISVDTTAPDAPGIDDPIAVDNIINAVEHTNGVIVRGTNAADVDTVTLCAGATDATDVTCTGGTSYTDTIAAGTTWSYTLTTDNITDLGDGDVTLTAIAADAAGNPAVSPGLEITVDTTAPVAPGIDDPVAIDNIISLAERDDGVTVRGTKVAEVTAVTLCTGATDATDVTCTGGTSYTDTARRRHDLELYADHR